MAASLVDAPSPCQKSLRYPPWFSHLHSERSTRGAHRTCAELTAPFDHFSFDIMSHIVLSRPIFFFLFYRDCARPGKIPQVSVKTTYRKAGYPRRVFRPMSAPSTTPLSPPPPPPPVDFQPFRCATAHPDPLRKPRMLLVPRLPWSIPKNRRTSLPLLEPLPDLASSNVLFQSLIFFRLGLQLAVHLFASWRTGPGPHVFGGCSNLSALKYFQTRS